MSKRFQLSLRELCFVTTIVALAIALYIATSTESAPMYLHVFGSMVDSTHDNERPPDTPMSPHGVPWTRIATVEIYDNRPFGFFTPNNRLPSIAIDGRLNRGIDDKYRGSIHFWLDDNNMTYDFTESVSLTPDEVVTIDSHFDIYLLSPEEDPYWALSNALQGDSDFSH
jgi:hypothetical protein